MTFIKVLPNLFVIAIFIIGVTGDSRCLGQDDGCCTPETPCDYGEGDCDSNDDCRGDLVCGNNNCPRSGAFFNSGDDCCESLTTRQRRTAEVSAIRCKGDDVGCCTPETPCGFGEGDCDSDEDCLGDYICGENNCRKSGWEFDQSDDCCTTRPKCRGEDGCCTRQRPCGRYEGDCDWDFQCQPGLRCGSNNCPKNVENFEAGDDCCE